MSRRRMWPSGHHQTPLGIHHARTRMRERGKDMVSAAPLTESRPLVAPARIFAFSALLAISLFAVPASASAAGLVGGDHVFDPVLSLTGDSLTSKSDPVPDPGPNHPSTPFHTTPSCVPAVDSNGYVYVSNRRNDHIDIFNPASEFVVEIPTPPSPCDLAVDSNGTLYLDVQDSQHKIVSYTPDAYPPTSSVSYGESASIVPPNASFGFAVNRATDHV